MKWTILAVALALPATAWAAAPFCVVTSAGAQCFYWDLNSCRQAAGTMQGMCTANPEAMRPTVQPVAPVQYQMPATLPQIQQPNFTESYRQGMEMGIRRRQAKQADEEHAARMHLLEAQAQAVQTQPEPTYVMPSQQVEPSTAAPSEYYRVIYRCGPEGSTQYTPHPAPGCVVISVVQ